MTEQNKKKRLFECNKTIDGISSKTKKNEEKNCKIQIEHSFAEIKKNTFHLNNRIGLWFYLMLIK